MRRTLVALLWLVFAWAATGPGIAWAAQVQVLSSDTQGIRLRVEVDQAQLIPVSTEEGAYHRLEIPGTYPGGEPGLPMLPGLGRWLVLPPSGEARLTYRVEAREDLGVARLLPHPTPVRQPSAEFGVPSLQEEYREGPAYAAFTTSEDDVVRLERPVWSRRQRMAALRIRPVLYDASSGRVEVIKTLEVSIEFTQSTSALPEPGEVDRIIRRGVLNPDQAGAWRTLAPGQARDRERWNENQRRRWESSKDADTILPLDASALLSDEIRVRVSRTGLHRIRVADLIDEQGFPADVVRKNVRLYQKRPSPRDGAFYPQALTVDVPLMFVGNPDPEGTISPDDWLVFYGLNPQDDAGQRLVGGELLPVSMAERPDNFNTTNVYTLAAVDPGAGTWARMEMETLAPAQGPALASFRRVDRYEDDAGYQSNPKTLEQPRFHWNEFTDKEVLRGVEVFHPVPDSSIDFTFTLVRRAESLAAPFNLVFALTTPVTTLDLGSVNLQTGFTNLEPVLRPLNSNDVGTGVVTFRMTKDNPNSSVGAFLGSLTFEYDAFYRAAGNLARFHTNQTGGEVDLEVEGFTDAELLVYEITDPYAPKIISLGGGNLVGTAPDLTLSLRVPQPTGLRREFAAQTLVRLTRLRGVDLERDSVADLIESMPATQVLAIGPAEFEEAFQPWLDHRIQTDPFGWEFAYVDVQQIYDQFSSGLKSPRAIKSFAEYAYTMWDARALVLVGDANEDTREAGADPVPDHVPPSVHLQDFDETELLASDKWYGLFCTDIDGNPEPCMNYPRLLRKGPDMLVGRIPANDLAELNSSVAKILAYEQPGADDEWRRRTLWMADDPYSSDYLGAGELCYNYRSVEEGFANGQRTNADIVTNSLDSWVTAQVWDLDDEINPDWRVERPCGNGTQIDRNGVIIQVGNFLVRPLQNLLSQGWLMVSYQGHAAFNVLAHETILIRAGTSGINNDGKPFVFFGMGCHVSDFLQAQEGRLGKALGEELMMLPNRGAIASYGSSGFEFLTPNKNFMEVITRNFFERLEDDRAPGELPRPPITSDPLESVWILGEQFAQSEMEILSTITSSKEEMMAQYNLLGDPLLRMDEAPPRLTATVDGGDLVEGAELVATSGQSISIDLDAVDFAGIDRVEITDDKARDYTSMVQYLPSSDPRQKTGMIDLPIYPQGYAVQIRTFDGSYRQTRPRELNLVVPFALDVTIDGEPVEEGAGSVAAGTSVVMSFTSPVAVAETAIGVTMDGGAIGALSPLATDAFQWDVAFDVVSVDGSAQALHLVLDGYDTTFDLSEGGGPATDLALGLHYPYPNPARDRVMIVAESSAEVSWCALEVYDLNGRALFRDTYEGPSELQVRPSSSGSGFDLMVEWNCRDNRGDDLANGVYFYRIEVGDGSQATESSMGRVVMMR